MASNPLQVRGENNVTSRQLYAKQRKNFYVKSHFVINVVDISISFNNMQ